MVLRTESVKEHLKELDTVLQELDQFRSISLEMYDTNITKRWAIERGLTVAASFIFDIADHILAKHFGYYAETYENFRRLA